MNKRPELGDGSGGLDVRFGVTTGEGRGKQLATRTGHSGSLARSSASHRKLPCGFRDRVPAALMTLCGWESGDLLSGADASNRTFVNAVGRSLKRLFEI